LQSDVSMRVENFVRDVADQIPDWANDFTPTNKFKVIAVEDWKIKGAKKQAEVLATEVAEHINSKITREYTTWAKQDLTPFVQQRVVEITEGVEQEVDEIVIEIDAMKKVLKGEAKSDYEPPSGLERLLAGSAGFIVGGVGSAHIGATLGTKEMLKSLGPAIGIVLTGTLLLGITNPVILIGMLFAGSFLQSVLKEGKIARQIKDSTAKMVASELRNNARSVAAKGAAAVHEKTEGIQKALKSSMENELRNVDELIESVLSEKKLGDARCKEKAEELSDASQELKKVQADLNDLIFDHALPST
ncbi:MAG: hypothetical protein WBD31_15065, partial [Rubripirellula sp.]